MPKRKAPTADFKRRKFKVGKKLQRANLTDASFKSRKVNVPLQASLVAEDQDTSAAVVAVRESVARASHYSASNRKDAFWSLRSTATKQPQAIVSVLGEVLTAISEHISDQEDAVRQAAIAAFAAVTEAVPEASVEPFFPLIVIHLRSSLSKLMPELRHDALAFVVVLARAYPNLLASHALRLAGAVARVLGGTDQALVVRSLAASILPVTLLTKKQQRATKSSSAARRPGMTSAAGGLGSKVWVYRKLSSLDSRVCCIYTLKCLLKLLAPSSGLEQSQPVPSPRTVVWSPTAFNSATMFTPQPADAFTHVAAPVAAAETSKKEQKGSMFAALVATWMECEPAAAHTATATALNRMSLVVQVMHLLLTIIRTGIDTATHEPDVETMTTTLVEKLMAHYPFDASSTGRDGSRNPRLQLAGAVSRLMSKLVTRVHVLGKKKSRKQAKMAAAAAAVGSGAGAGSGSGEALPSNAAKWVTAMIEHVKQQLGGTGRVGDSETDAEFSTAGVKAFSNLLDCLRHLVRRCEEGQRVALLKAFTSFWRRVASSSAMQGTCIQFVHSMAPWNQAASEEAEAAQASPEVLAEWVQQVPVLLRVMNSALEGDRMMQLCTFMLEATRRLPRASVVGQALVASSPALLRLFTAPASGLPLPVIAAWPENLQLMLLDIVTNIDVFSDALLAALARTTFIASLTAQVRSRLLGIALHAGVAVGLEARLQLLLSVALARDITVYPTVAVAQPEVPAGLAEAIDVRLRPAFAAEGLKLLQAVLGMHSEGRLGEASGRQYLIAVAQATLEHGKPQCDWLARSATHSAQAAGNAVVVARLCAIMLTAASRASHDAAADPQLTSLATSCTASLLGGPTIAAEDVRHCSQLLAASSPAVRLGVWQGLSAAAAPGTESVFTGTFARCLLVMAQREGLRRSLAELAGDEAHAAAFTAVRGSLTSLIQAWREVADKGLPDSQRSSAAIVAQLRAVLDEEGLLG